MRLIRKRACRSPRRRIRHSWSSIGVAALVTLAIAPGCRQPHQEPAGYADWEARQAQESHSTKDAGSRDHAAETSPALNGKSAGATPASGNSSDSLPAPSANAIRSDVLVLNDETITTDDVLDPIRKTLEEDASSLSAIELTRRRDLLVRQTLIETIAERLIWQEARRQLGDENEPQLKKAVDAMERDRINREFDGREARYVRHLTKTGKTRDDVRNMLRRKIVVNQYLKEKLIPMVPEPGKPELKRYYDAHQDEFTKEPKREMFLIEIPVESFLERRARVTQERVQAATLKARAEADAAIAELALGQSFEDIAKRRSRGIKKSEGGRVGFVSSVTSPFVGKYEPAWKRLCELPEGRYSQIIEVPGSTAARLTFFIVKAGRIQTGGVTSFQDAQPDIAMKIRERKFASLRTTFLQRRFDQSDVSSLDEFYRRVLEAAPAPGRS